MFERTNIMLAYIADRTARMDEQLAAHADRATRRAIRRAFRDDVEAMRERLCG